MDQISKSSMNLEIRDRKAPQALFFYLTLPSQTQLLMPYTQIEIATWFKLILQL